MKKIFLCFIIFPFSLLSQSIDVLFLGNSYTYANNTPQMVKDIALSFGDSLEFDSSTPGGATFNGHSTNSTTLNKISSIFSFDLVSCPFSYILRYSLWKVRLFALRLANEEFNP